MANFGNMILQTYAAVNGYSASSQGGSMDYSFTDTDSSVSSGSSSGQGMSTSTYQSIYSRWERQAKSNYESLTLLGGNIRVGMAIRVELPEVTGIQLSIRS